jgi:hypothetical protein
MALSLFDPFSFVDDDDDERVVSPATTTTTTTTTTMKSTSISSGSCSTSTSRTTNTISNADIAKENRLKAVKEDTNLKPIPPRLDVKFTLHEEVSSSATMDQSCEGGSWSQLFIEGKVSVSIEYKMLRGWRRSYFDP